MLHRCVCIEKTCGEKDRCFTLFCAFDFDFFSSESGAMCDVFYLVVMHDAKT